MQIELCVALIDSSHLFKEQSFTRLQNSICRGQLSSVNSILIIRVRVTQSFFQLYIEYPIKDLSQKSN